MKAIEIAGERREKTGSSEAVRIRRNGHVPCVLYGGKENVMFQVEEKSFKKLLYTPEVYAVKLTIDGKEYNSFLKSAQFHPVSDQLLHVDFIELVDDKTVSISLPVKLNGTAIGVRNGGVLRFTRPKLKVKALPKDLPDGFEVDIEDLDIGDAVKVEDIKSEGLEFLHSDNDVIVRVKVARAIIEPTTEAEEEVDLEAMTEEERAEYEKKKEDEAKEGGEEKAGEQAGEQGDAKPAEKGGQQAEG